MKRIVLLGASNLTLGFPQVSALAAWSWGPGPYRLLAAAGHGRGYAMPSRVLARGLPPIARCGLWRELERGGQRPTRALIADAGNDLAYGATAGATIRALGACLERLRAAAPELDAIVVLPPLAALGRLSRVRFTVLRSLLFPGRRFALAEILDGLRELDGELRRLAAEHGARTVEHDAAWIAIDGIHVRRRLRRRAWRSLLAAWTEPGGPPRAPAAAIHWRPLRAERASLLGLPVQRTQPARRLPDGTGVSFF